MHGQSYRNHPAGSKAEKLKNMPHELQRQCISTKQFNSQFTLLRMGMMALQPCGHSGTMWLCVLFRNTHEKNETAKNFRASEYVVFSIQNSDPMMSDCAAVGHISVTVQQSSPALTPARPCS